MSNITVYKSVKKISTKHQAVAEKRQKTFLKGEGTFCHTL